MVDSISWPNQQPADTCKAQSGYERPFCKAGFRVLTCTALHLVGEEVFDWMPSTQAAARGLNPQTAAPQQQQQQQYSASADAVDTSSAAAALLVLSDIGCLPVSSHDVLAWLVDLSAVPTRKVLEHLADSCPCPPEAVKLKAMASEEHYKQQVGLDLVQCESFVELDQEQRFNGASS
jgi:hypothetical protein